MRDIGLLYMRELRCALRERNIVVNSILLPIFLYPLLLWLVYTGISFVMGQTEGFVSRVAILQLPAEHTAFRKELEHDEQIRLTTSADTVRDLREGRLDAAVEFLPPQEGLSIDHNYRTRVIFDDSKDRSSAARTRLRQKLRLYRNSLLDAEARNRGISAPEFQRYWIDDRNIATGRQMGQFILGLILPVFMVIMLAIGSLYPSVDCTAGEREKFTWETLMTAATPRANIVIAKYLYVATMSSMAGILNITAMMLSMKSVMAPLLGSQGESFAFQIPPASIPLMLIITIPLAMFISAGMMILASFARTFKEGQAMVGPFYIAVFLPVLFLQVPGIELTTKLALIPIVNVVMVFREAISGIYRWPQIGITILVEAACVALALWLATTILKYEDFIIGSYGGNFGKFIKGRLLGRGRPRRSES